MTCLMLTLLIILQASVEGKKGQLEGRTSPRNRLLKGQMMSVDHNFIAGCLQSGKLERFVLQFNFVYIDKQIGLRYLLMIGCSCGMKRCEKLCCPSDKISLKKCTRSYPFEHTLGEIFQRHEEPHFWNVLHLCDAVRDLDKMPINFTESGAFTNLELYNSSILGKYMTIDDLKWNLKGHRQQIPPSKPNKPDKPHSPRRPHKPHKPFKPLSTSEVVTIFSTATTRSTEIVFSNYDGLPYQPEYNFWSHAIATPFVVMTLVVYVSLPNFRNVHGLSLVCLLVNIVACNILMVIAYWTEYNDFLFCTTISYLIFWSYMGKELWMFTIAFDLCIHFRAQMMAQRMSRPFKRVLSYGFFVWGSSSLVTLLLTFHQLYSVDEEIFCYVGSENCCLVQVEHLEKLTHYDCIETVFVALNVMFLVLTIMEIRRTDRAIEEDLARNDRNIGGNPQGNQNNAATFCKYFRLAVLTDLTWILSKVCHFIQESESRPLYRDIAWLVDIGLQSSKGIIIFFVFALNRRTRNAFWTRMKMTCCRSDNVEN